MSIMTVSSFSRSADDVLANLTPIRGRCSGSSCRRAPGAGAALFYARERESPRDPDRTARSDQRRKSAAAESLAQVLTLGLPPLVQDGDVGADGEVPDAHVEEVLRLIRGGDLGPGRHAHLDGRFEHAALHHS